MTTQAPIDPKNAPGQHKGPRVEVYWRAVTYKTVIVYVLILVGMISGGIYLLKPDLYSIVLKKIDEKVSEPDPDTVNADQKHAKFVNLTAKCR